MIKKSIVVGAAAGAFMMAGALGASASVIDFDASTAVISGANATVEEFPGANPLVREVTFKGDAPFYAYLDITVGRDFSITLEDYQPSESGTAQSFFSIESLGAPSFFVTQVTSCTTSTAIPALDSSGCNPVNGADGSAGNPPPITFGGLSAGTYRLAFFENGDPLRVQADFKISAVPLPAGGLLLLTALGGMAVVRRRRKAA